MADAGHEGLNSIKGLDPELFGSYVPYQSLVTFEKLDRSRELDDADITVYGMPIDGGSTYHVIDGFR